MATILIATFVALLSAARVPLHKRAKDASNGGMVVALGDSFSSGCGIHIDGDNYDERYGGRIPGYNFTDNDEGECFREVDTTPGGKYAAIHNKESISLACTSAEVHNVHAQIDYLQETYPNEAAEGWKDSVILATVAGNDLRNKNGDTWPDLLRRCVFELNCQNDDDNLISNLQEVEDMLTDLFTKLARVASKATIRVFGYPYLFQRNGGWCLSVLAGRLQWAADWLDSFVAIIDSVVVAAMGRAKAARSDVDLEFVSVLDYLNLGACHDSDDRHVHGVAVRWWGISPASFHPTQNGFDQYYQALLDSLH